jgi:hypothetical protein
MTQAAIQPTPAGKIDTQTAAARLLWAALIAAEKFSSVTDSKFRIRVSYLRLMEAAHSRSMTPDEFMALAKRDRFFWNPLSNMENLPYLRDLCDKFFAEFREADFCQAASATID